MEEGEEFRRNYLNKESKTTAWLPTKHTKKAKTERGEVSDKLSRTSTCSLVSVGNSGSCQGLAWGAGPRGEHRLGRGPSGSGGYRRRAGAIAALFFLSMDALLQ